MNIIGLSVILSIATYTSQYRMKFVVLNLIKPMILSLRATAKTNEDTAMVCQKEI